MKIKLITGALALSVAIFTGCANNYMDTDKKMNSATLLSDSKSMTLYTFDKDTMNKSNCYGGCETKWPVFNGNKDGLNLPEGISKSDFGTIKRKNGAMQTTYNGKPLYYFFMDKKANDKNGNGKKGVWHIVK